METMNIYSINLIRLGIANANVFFLPAKMSESTLFIFFFAGLHNQLFRLHVLFQSTSNIRSICFLM